MESPIGMDNGRAEYRENVRALDRLLNDVTEFTAANPEGSAAQVLSAWHRLQGSMSLAEDRALVACPHCGVAGTQGGLRCSGCWNLLTVKGSTLVGAVTEARGIA